MGGGDLETNRRLQIHRLFRWGSRQQCPTLLPALKWRAIRPQATELFTAQLQGDSLSCLPAEFGDSDVESASTPSSDTSAKRAERLAQAIESDSTQGSQAPDPRPCTPCLQQLSPPLFVPWSQVAKLRGVVAVQKGH